MFKLVVYANIMFWIVSNFICYLAWYERSLSGFIKCYFLAIPFFFGTLAKTLIVAYVIKALVRRYEVRA